MCEMIARVLKNKLRAAFRECTQQQRSYRRAVVGVLSRFTPSCLDEVHEMVRLKFSHKEDSKALVKELLQSEEDRTLVLERYAVRSD